MNILVIGKDERMDYVANQLYSLGCEIIRNVNSIINKSVVLLSPPVSNEHYELLEPYLDNISCIYGGAICQDFIRSINGAVPVIDYLTFPNLVWENALLTAKGIIKEAILKIVDIKNKKILITGYGYCGKAIALELKKYNCNIYVAVRNQGLKAVIELENFKYIDLKQLGTASNNFFDCVFNTIPARVITSQVIDNFNNSTGKKLVLISKSLYKFSVLFSISIFEDIPSS